MAVHHPLDFYSATLDEIALEGLDGIAIEALWLRLHNRPDFTFPLDDFGRNCIWSSIPKCPQMEFYQLPAPREPLVIFNRYDHVDPHLGIVLEPTSKPKDLYPHHLVNDVVMKIKGSCKDFNTRENITELVRGCKLTLSEVIERWGSSLVIVASQSAREFALLGGLFDPNNEMSPIRYCIMERIGRSRYHGEITQGKASLQDVGEDPGSLFYHRKFFMGLNLVTKQVHHQKAGFQNMSGSLLHLPRFYVERQSKTLIITQRVVSILRERPNYVADYEEIRKQLGVNVMMKKLFKTPHFKRFVKLVTLPYRALYPEAKVQEWKRKKLELERSIRALQLINPDVDDSAIWMKDEEADLEPEEVVDNKVLPRKGMLHDRSILHQVFLAMDQAGPEGVSQTQVTGMLGLTRLQSRAVCRSLLRLGLVSTLMSDVGRQRVTKYMSKRYVEDSQLAQQFNIEKEKMFSLMSNNKKSTKSRKGGSKLKVTEAKNKSAPTRGKKKRGESSVISKEVSKKIRLDEACEKPADLPAVTSALSTDTITPDEPTTPPDSVAVVTEQSSVNDGRVLKESVEDQMTSIETTICEMKDVNFYVHDTEGFVEKLNQSQPKQLTKDTPNVTYRLLKRANQIIEAVQKHKVIDDVTKLSRMINDSEEKEGYTQKMDRKSMLRMLLKMNKDKSIKFFRILLKSEGKEKILNFVCQPDILYDDPLIQSVVEQEKMKFFVLSRDRIVKMEVKPPPPEKDGSPLFNEQIAQSINELKAMTAKKKDTTFTYDKSAGKRYGFCPKFIRMRTLHQLLFYIVCDYRGDPNLDQASAIAGFRDAGIRLTETDIAELPTAYRTELNWKTFIPPLPAYPGWPAGWTVICDVLLRIPLSVFVRVFNLSYKVPRLTDYLSHPTRKHYLLKSLPLAIRNNLLVGRKYIFSCHEVLQRLCCVGLTQFGPQRLKEKDQVFVYMNRHTELLDTMSSTPAYHQISEEMEYTAHTHHFNTLDDVDKYWYEMWNICLHTRLGGRLCMVGKDIVLESVFSKPAMVDAIRVRTLEEAPTLDNGLVPGDRRGAAGLDSSLFSHLKRNWNWTNEVKGSDVNDIPDSLRKKRLDSLKPQPIKFGEIMNSVPSKRAITARMIAKRVHVAKKTVPAKIKPLQAVKSQKMQTVVRSFRQTKAKLSSRPWYDDIDHKTEESMTRRRVKWTEDEDNLLLLCKVAFVYICPNPRKQLITFVAVRDICHAAMPSTRNKTSRAHQRRMLVMMKNKLTVKNVALHLEEVKQDEFINKRFGRVVSEARQISTDLLEVEKIICDKFKLLVAVLRKKFDRKSLLNNGLLRAQASTMDLLPDTHHELIDNCEVVRPPVAMKRKGTFQMPKQITDIHSATVSAIVHSTLCCLPDKTSFMYQLFKIYQQYPDNLLRSVMAKLRTDQMVSLRKTYVQRLHKSGNYLPVSSLPYQLSVAYFYLLQTRYEYEVFSESYAMTKRLLWHDADDTDGTHQGITVVGSSNEFGRLNGLDCVDLDGGSTAAMVELFCLNSAALDLEIPDNIVVLDPRISKTDETYIKILARYQEIVRDITKDISPAADILTKPTFIATGEKEGEQPGTADQDSVMARTTTCKFAPSALRKFVPPLRNEDSSDSEDGSDVDEPADISTQLECTTQYTIARAASRIALFSMRDDFLLRGRAGGDSQHTHDFLMVNSCKVRCRLLSAHSGQHGVFTFQGQLAEPVAGDGQASAQQQQEMNSRKEDYVKVVGNIRSKLVVPEGIVTAEEAQSVFLNAGASNADWKQACIIVIYLQEKIEIGATIKELREKFSNLPCDMSLIDLLHLLTKSWYVVRVGITTVHFVFHKFARPWLLHSYKIRRLEREKLPQPLNMAKRKLDDDTKTSQPTKRRRSNSSPVDNPGASQTSTSENRLFPSEGVIKKNTNMFTASKESDQNANTNIQGSLSIEQVGNSVIYDVRTANKEDNNFSEQTSKDNVMSLKHADAGSEEGPLVQEENDENDPEAKMLETPLGELSKHLSHENIDVSDTEPVRILIRPWVRVDGSFNRRVLDRFCGSVLGFCMTQPGISMKKIQDRFSPALQPVHTREIIEILEKLGCLKLQVLSSDWRPTLFSKASPIRLRDATGFEDESAVFVNLAVDAITRLGAFIGDKLYKRDFLQAK